MNRTAAAVLHGFVAVAVASVMAGCSMLDGPLPPSTPTGGPSGTTGLNGTTGPGAVVGPHGPGTAALGARLLAQSDLPAGYTPMTMPSGDDGSLDGCPALDASPAHPTATATVSFGNAVGGTLSETITQSSVADATAALATLSTVPRSCGTFTATVGSTKIPLTTAELDAPKLGDQEVAVRITASIAAIGLDEDVVTIRTAGTVVQLAFVSIGAGNDAGQGTNDTIAGTAYRKALGS